MKTREWPYDGSCEADVHRAAGWRPVPINEYILKIESRCNLNCDYCYVYNMGDESWRSAPRMMSFDIAKRAAERIRDHAVRHDMPRIGLSFHGGEPLLHGLDPIRRYVSIFTEVLAPVEAEFSLQTNATLVTPEIAKGLHELGIRVGVSIDGDEDGNRHRLDLGGKSTYARVVAGIDRLRDHPDVLQGILAVIDIRNPPLATYEALRALDLKSIDFLLPHGTWEKTPPLKNGRRGTGQPAPYGDWLATIYSEWAADDDRPRVRIFDDMIHLLLGGESAFEMLGLSPARLAVVESNGDLELVDHIGITYDGAAETVVNVLTHPVDALLEHPGVVARQIGEKALHDDCVSCELKELCGGGLITHRYDPDGGFKNPSVYCSDLYRLFSVIHDDLVRRIEAPQSA
ncbi:hypothetical protein BFG51_04105 [Dietzia alimentaria]|nr:hypothetical protein BFG51_04105 [Dietzia alimentaria]